jgi:predicted ATPase
MNAVKVPATVQAVLAARIDHLSAEEKELLQTLAVIGREFPLSLVRRVVDLNENDELEVMLANLQTAEFIYEQPATAEIEYIFKHALTQEVSYNSILTACRRQLHESIGQAIESIYGDTLAERIPELAIIIVAAEIWTKRLSISCLPANAPTADAISTRRRSIRNVLSN